jgi:hypothetical protein
MTPTNDNDQPIPAPVPTPVKPTPAPTQHGDSEAAKRIAATSLYDYLTSNGANWGTKAYPSKPVRETQVVFGVTADGIFGPATNAVMKSFGLGLRRPSSGKTVYDPVSGLGPISW